MTFGETDQAQARMADEAAATVQFYDGLRELARTPGMAANFGRCLAQLADQPDYAAQFHGMLGFLEEHQAHGYDMALRAVEGVQGIPVDVVQQGGTPSETYVRAGRVVGLLGADRERAGKFLGVVCTEVDNSGEAFVPAEIDIHALGVVRRIREQA
jgi:hypothetical protein